MKHGAALRSYTTRDSDKRSPVPCFKIQAKERGGGNIEEKCCTCSPSIACVPVAEGKYSDELQHMLILANIVDMSHFDALAECRYDQYQDILGRRFTIFIGAYLVGIKLAMQYLKENVKCAYAKDDPEVVWTKMQGYDDGNFQMQLTSPTVVSREMLRYKIQWNGNSDRFTQFMMSYEAYLIQSGQNYITEKCFREAYIKGGCSGSSTGLCFMHGDKLRFPSDFSVSTEAMGFECGMRCSTGLNTEVLPNGCSVKFNANLMKNIMIGAKVASLAILI